MMSFTTSLLFIEPAGAVSPKMCVYASHPDHRVWSVLRSSDDTQFIKKVIMERLLGSTNYSHSANEYCGRIRNKKKEQV